MDKERRSAIDQATGFVRDLAFDGIPAATVATAKALLRDTIGVAAAAARCAVTPVASDLALAFMAAGSAGDSARLLFDGRRASRLGAIYAGAARIDNLEAHDGIRRAKGHIGVALLPALLGFADGQAGLTGREALTALIIGYEIGSRAGIVLHAQAAEYHNSGAWNALGAAALGARLRGLGAARIRAALGIAEFFGPRGLAMRGVDHPSMLGDGSAWGALTGAAACLLAERGHTGAPAETVECPDALALWSDLGSRWLTDEQYVKLHTICGFGHAAVDAAALLHRQHAIPPADIVAVEIGSFTGSERLDGGMPADASTAQFRIPFAVATTLVRGRVGPEETMGSGLRDPAIARLVAVTRVTPNTAYDRRLPARWADVTVRLADGRSVGSGPVMLRGGPDAPASAAELQAKWQSYAGPVLGAARMGAIEAAVAGLDAPGARFADLLALVLAPVAAP